MRIAGHGTSTACPPPKETGPSAQVVEVADPCVRQFTGAISTNLTCAGVAAQNVPDCTGETPRLDPAEAAAAEAAGLVAGPRVVRVLACPEIAEPVPLAVTVTVEEFRALPLTPSAIWVGPPGGWLPVNMVNVVYTDGASQTLPTTVLGQPVLVRATPTFFAWDFGDGSAPLVTTDPGRPHPDHTVSNTYARVGEYTVAMTTTWSGEFSVDGGTTFVAIDGTAETTSTGAPVTVTELRSFLVDGAVT